MYYAVAGIVFFATFAMMVREGIWGNLLNVLSIILAGIVAFGAYQPITVMLDERTGGSYTYLLDYLVLWGLFAITVGVLKGIGGFVSIKRVKFLEPVDNFGGAAIGFVGGLIMTSLAMATLHTAPFGKEMFPELDYGATLGEVKSAYESASPFTKLDSPWLGFAEWTLNGARFGSGAPASLMGAQTTTDFSAPFYLYMNGKHREAFGKMEDTFVKRSGS
ncbi:MAG: CvpA family protein [Lacipirellulaceae bacterium]